MKILVNALSARMGGIVTYTSNLMRSFSARGIDATFAVPPEFPAPDSARVLRFRANRMRPSVRLLWEQTVWRRVIAREKPDLLFSSANFGVMTSSVPQLLLVREGGLFDPYYITNISPGQGIRAAFFRMARRKLIQASMRAADSVMVPTEAMKASLLSWSPGLSDKISCNLYGTRLDLFSASGIKRQWRADGMLRLLYVSEYYPHKRPGMMADVVARLNEAGIKSKLTITMTLDSLSAFSGSDEDHFLLSKGIERGQVEMTGHIPYENIPALYRDHDIFVFPSVAETFGHPLVEAMDSGMPILLAERPVNREVCGDAAVYFDPLSITDAVDQICRLDASPDLRQRLSENGVRRCAGKFEWEDHVERLIREFERITSRREKPCAE